MWDKEVKKITELFRAPLLKKNSLSSIQRSRYKAASRTKNRCEGALQELILSLDSLSKAVLCHMSRQLYFEAVYLFNYKLLY